MSLNQDGVLKGWREARLTGEPEAYAVKGDEVWLRTGVSPHEWWHKVEIKDGEVTGCYFPSLPDWNLVRYLSSGQKRKIIQVLGAGG